MKKLLANKIIIILIIIFVVIFLHYVKILKPLEDGIQLVLKPLQSGLTGIANYLGSKISIIFINNHLQEENNQLRNEVIELWKENSALKIMEKENFILKTELGYTQQNQDYTFITGKVISQDTLQNPSVIAINIGSKHGIKIGLPVLINEGILVGKVSKIEENISHITLLSNNDNRVAAAFVGIDGSSGIVTGKHNLSIEMTLIPSDIIIEEGLMVITSGVEEKIHTGFLIGRIKKITKLPNDLFQSATLEAPVDYSSLKYVVIPIN